jgi:hypothetical protein
VETPRVEIPFPGCRSPFCLLGSHAGMVPLETSRRVYTWDVLFGGVCASAIGDLRVSPAPRGQCQKPHAVCTRGMDFLTTVGPGGNLPPENPSHVYTRDGLSGKASLHNARQLGKRRGSTASLPKISSHVYTRTHFLALAEGDDSALSPLPRERRSLPSIQWLPMPFL